MNLVPACHDKIAQLVHKGVQIPNPLTLDIGPEVDINRISANGVMIYPGCRIYGARTLICEGAQLGAEGPATVDNCQVGPGVKLKGGYFNKAVFLDKSNMGLGAHVREGCILEEEAGGAHCVGLKQTILFPFVTLGSLINFCDCLMAGGTSRKNHSEVGSSYIHFNFTPDGNKTTASLFGDVPRGVMLNQPPIFLGGQGGTVGPVRLGFGSVVAAGGVLRSDQPDDGKLVIPPTHAGMVRDHKPHAYKNLRRIVGNNLRYLANLVALEQWYRHVRRPFFARREFGEALYEGALSNLAAARKERLSRLNTLAANIPENHPENDACNRKTIAAMCEAFNATDHAPSNASRDEFLKALEQAAGHSQDYITTVQSLPPDVSAKGTRWLQELVETLAENRF